MPTDSDLGVSLRAVEPADIDCLFSAENDTQLWKYSNRFQPYSRQLLIDYIAQAHRDIFEIRQLKFTILSPDSIAIGFIDLYDFEPLHHRAGIGLVVEKDYRKKGYGNAALGLLEDYVKVHLQMHQLYAHIAIENQTSIRLFENRGYNFVGTRKDWNFYEGRYHDEAIYQKIFK